MRVVMQQRVAHLRREIGHQLSDIRHTWTQDARARFWVGCAVTAGFGVVALAIAVDILRYFDLHHYRARFLSLTTDRSLPELVMDGLVLTAAALTAGLFGKTGLRSFLFVAVLLVLVALDDFFSFHETLGSFLVERLSIPDMGSLKGQALGELVFLAAFALVCVPFLIWTAWGMQPANLAVLVLYGSILAFLAAFSGGVDVLHSLAQSSFMDRLMGWIEESGEIMAITVLTSVAILQAHGSLAA